MKKLKIRNDNNKLHCTSFLHICLYHGVDAWPLDQGYEIYSPPSREVVGDRRVSSPLGEMSAGQRGFPQPAHHARGYIGEAKIIRKQVSTIGQLNESVAEISIGFSLQVLKAELASQATSGFPATNDTKVHIITFRYLKYGKAHPLKDAPIRAYDQRKLWNTKETQKESPSSVTA